MQKVLFVATVVKTHIMEFHLPYLKMFKEEGWRTAVAAKNDYEDPADCRIPYCDDYFDVPFGRNPIAPENRRAFRQLKSLIDNGKYDIIHCHTPVGAALARLAATDARKKGTKLIYTAHGFHFFKGASPLNWILFYPVERWLSRMTDVLITINKEDYERAKAFGTCRVEYVPGVGIDTDKFKAKEDQAERSVALKAEFDIPEGVKVMLSVGEFTKNKNHRTVIKALEELDDYYYVICGRGAMMEDCKALAEETGVSDRLVLAGYRNDADDFYHMADVFVHPSFREGLPVAVMEALASGLAVVATRIRGSADLVEDGVNGFLVDDPADPEAFVAAIRMAEDFIPDTSAIKNYDIREIMQKVKRIYFG